MGSDLERWGDRQQYHAEKHGDVDPTKGVEIKATLLWMTAQPLQVLGAFNAIYSGKVVRNLDDVTDEEARKALADCMATHLKAPLESIKLHFLLEGVDRAMTHQLVRQRTAVYGQESMRFAVVNDLLDATSLPPSLQGTHRFGPGPKPEGMSGALYSKTQAWRNRWDHALEVIDETYRFLVADGMPAEEARGLLPHATATRVHYITDLRNLSDHAGNRLCTQAQFPWRILFTRIVEAIRNYQVAFPWVGGDDSPFGTSTRATLRQEWQRTYGWQYHAIADSALFRPVCYQVGHCPFQASFDRHCSIRERVEWKAKNGVASSEWDKTQWPKHDDESGVVQDVLPAIKPEEWLANPGAART